MIILITGATRSGKTLCSEHLVRLTGFRALSIDLLKMGLIRAKCTNLTPTDDDALQEYLWPIIREIIKTAIENHENLIIEGDYIPASLKKDFTKEEISEIYGFCMILTENFIKEHCAFVIRTQDVVQDRRHDDTPDLEELLSQNKRHERDFVDARVPIVKINSPEEHPVFWEEFDFSCFRLSA